MRSMVLVWGRWYSYPLVAAVVTAAVAGSTDTAVVEAASSAAGWTSVRKLMIGEGEKVTKKGSSSSFLFLFLFLSAVSVCHQFIISFSSLLEY